MVIDGDDETVGVDAEGDDVAGTGEGDVDDESAFWFHVMALGWVGSWLIWKMLPVIFWWLLSGST